MVQIRQGCASKTLASAYCLAGSDSTLHSTQKGLWGLTASPWDTFLYNILAVLVSTLLNTLTIAYFSIRTSGKDHFLKILQTLGLLT